jgi:hypothetical protein
MDYSTKEMFNAYLKVKSSRSGLHVVNAQETGWLPTFMERQLPQLRSASKCEREPLAASGASSELFSLEEAIAQIVIQFDEARWERETLLSSSPEWHKLTGEMLAYAKVTALLQIMKSEPPSAAQSPE